MLGGPSLGPSPTLDGQAAIRNGETSFLTGPLPNGYRSIIRPSNFREPPQREVPRMALMRRCGGARKSAHGAC
jgi:hypothetical protein